MPFLSKISLVFLIVASTTLASPIHNNNPNDPSNEQPLTSRTVRILIQNSGVRELTIPTNGQFAYDELDFIDILDAKILSDGNAGSDGNVDNDDWTLQSLQQPQESQEQQHHTTCFFWRSWDEGKVPFAYNDAFVSSPIYSTGQTSMVQPYRSAERVYCYDSTGEHVHASKNMVTIFAQNAQEEQKLLRLPVSAEEKIYTLPFLPKPQSSGSMTTTTTPSSPEPQDEDLQGFSARGVTGMAIMYAPRTDSYCLVDAGPRKVFALQKGAPLKFQPPERVYEVECRY